jgi:hypothetical protein
MMIKKALGCLGMILLFAILGWVAAFLLSLAYTGGTFNPWIAAPLPKGQVAEHFTSTEGPYAKVSTLNDSLFAYPLNPEEQAGWKEISGDETNLPVEANAEWECQPVTMVQFTLYRPPGRTRERLECFYTIYSNLEYQGSSTYIYRFAIQENGEIWRWENFTFGWRSLGYLLYFSPYGLIGGAILGLLLFGLISWLRARYK